MCERPSNLFYKICSCPKIFDSKCGPPRKIFARACFIAYMYNCSGSPPIRIHNKSQALSMRRNWKFPTGEKQHVPYRQLLGITQPYRKTLCFMVIGCLHMHSTLPAAGRLVRDQPNQSSRKIGHYAAKLSTKLFRVVGIQIALGSNFITQNITNDSPLIRVDCGIYGFRVIGCESHAVQ